MREAYIRYNYSPTTALPGAWDQISRAHAAATQPVHLRGLGQTTSELSAQVHSLVERATAVGFTLDELPSDVREEARLQLRAIETDLERAMEAEAHGDFGEVEDLVSIAQSRLMTLEAYAITPDAAPRRRFRRLLPTSLTADAGLPTWAWWTAIGVGLAAVAGGVFYFTRTRGRKPRRRRRKRR